MNILDIDFHLKRYIISFLSIDNFYSVSEISKDFHIVINSFYQKQKRRIPHIYYITSSISLIEWAKKHRGFKYTNDTFKFASRNGDITVLKYLYNDRCPNFYNDSGIMYEAAQNGFFDILKWGYNKKVKIDHTIFMGATQNGNLKIIKWLYENDFPYNEYTCHFAAWNGNLEVMKFLIKHEFPWNSRTFDYAASGGNLRMLRYLNNLAIHDLGLNWWTSETFTSAVENGQLNILKFLKKNNCPMSVDATYTAAKNNYIDILIWLIENNCPIDFGLFNSFQKEYNISFSNKNINFIYF
jgi:hypothetical protein